MKKVSLYIPCFNAAKTISTCLEGVLKLDYPLEEIVVVDDGSTDDTAGVAGGYPVRLIRLNNNKGLACARNTAIKSMNTEFIASLDADCIPGKNWLKNIMAVFDKEKVSGVGGKLVEKSESLTDIWRREHFTQHWGDKQVYNPRFLFGSNTVFRKDALHEIGLYDERFKTNYEDCDISIRLKEKGCKLLYTPDAIVKHERSDTLFSLFDAFWNWNLHFYETQKSYGDLANLSLKIKDNIGLSNRFIEEDSACGREFLLYIDFLLSLALTLKDLSYFYKLESGGLPVEYNRKLISFLYLTEQEMFLRLGALHSESRLKKEFIKEQAAILLIMFSGCFFRERFSNNSFYKIWLRDALILYFENTDISMILSIITNFINLFSFEQLEHSCEGNLAEVSKAVYSAFLGNFEIFFSHFKLNEIAKSSLYSYEENIKLLEKGIKSTEINLLPESYEQFVEDCGYYYSRILNYPFVAPAVIQFDFMRRCQLQCRICKIWSNIPTKSEEELKYEELKLLLDQASDLGVKRCYFSAGEPFMLPYLFEIIKYCGEKNISTEVTTNGLLLTEDNCRRLIELPLNQLNVSIDGALAETHDYHRNRPGLFNAVINNLKMLVKLKNDADAFYPNINMACVLTDKNYSEMLDYVKFAQELGVNAFFQPYVSENDRYYYRSLKDEFDLSSKGPVFKAILTEIERVIEHKRKYIKRDFIANTEWSLENLKKLSADSLKNKEYCFSGFNRIIIFPDKRVNICPGTIGDFSKNTLKEIWFSKEAQELRTKILNCPSPCFLGSSYQPGPSVNDIFLITKRYILSLKKRNEYGEKPRDCIVEHLMKYMPKLQEKGLWGEKEKLGLVLKSLTTSGRGAWFLKKEIKNGYN